jgi:hypothetical protein
VSLLHLLAACAAAPEGLMATPDGDGPEIVVDWDAEPLPEIPFPNDLATRPDPLSSTGLRVNVPTEAATHAESEARLKLNQLTGFGVYAPITVAFSERLDIDEIIARHPDDFHDPLHFRDDAILVIDVDPDSPDYLQAVDLDLGHGRFPLDVPRTDRYFPNDARSESPTLIFETYEEDLDGDGVLDPGEDTDADGVLDHPNVWPPGGDPRADLLTFYELESDTLIVRPVVPLREETTYAVVLTNRLVGEGGEPVRSPWPYINHTRQTEALTPVLDALGDYDLSLPDVAFAWTFTTGRVTGDLLDLRRGLVDGEGPYPHLAQTFPAAVEEALQNNDVAGADPYALPVDVLMGALVDLGLLEGDGAEMIAEMSTTWSDYVVGGSFTTPYLLADRDDGGRWDADEAWMLEPSIGLVMAQPQRVAFSCVIPKAGPGAQPPFPVAMFGHGYGSSRFDVFGFAWAFNRVGVAVCSMDFPGHGPTIPDDQLALINAVLAGEGLSPFLSHLQDARYRDLNNDGVPDSGGDQWSADSFHTRDMVRQAAVDWVQMYRAFRACGDGSMAKVAYDGEGGRLEPSGDAVSCDWNGDGTPDLGGDVRYMLAGGSLGGIDSAVTVPLLPEIAAWAPIAPGGGTLDIGVRTEIGGAVEALAGRIVGPLILGVPDGVGGLTVTQMVNSVTDMVELPIAHLDAVPSGGFVTVENLRTGVSRTAPIPVDGTFRVSVAADALDPFEKRMLVGMPDDDPAGLYTVEDNTELGDALSVTITDAAGAVVAELVEWESTVAFEGVTMEEGTTLVAASTGLGHIRGTPPLRRLASVLSSALEPGDAISYAPRWHDEPYAELGSKPASVLLMPTPGDTIVNINTGIALARSSGLIRYDTIDDRYGTSVDRWLIDVGAVQGLEEHGPWVCADGAPCLFDVDDQDDGTDGTGAPSVAPLRATRTDHGGVSGLRMPYVSTTGSHAFALPEPNAPFDISTFALMQVGWFLASGELSDDPCLATADCSFFREAP